MSFIYLNMLLVWSALLFITRAENVGNKFLFRLTAIHNTKRYTNKQKYEYQYEHKLTVSQ